MGNPRCTWHAEGVAKWAVSCGGWLVRRRDDLIMALGYRRVDRDQQFLLPPDMREWLPESHLVWFVIETVDQLDTLNRPGSDGGSDSPKG